MFILTIHCLLSFFLSFYLTFTLSIYSIYSIVWACGTAKWGELSTTSHSLLFCLAVNHCFPTTQSSVYACLFLFFNFFFPLSLLFLFSFSLSSFPLNQLLFSSILLPLSIVVWPLSFPAPIPTFVISPPPGPSFPYHSRTNNQPLRILAHRITLSLFTLESSLNIFSDYITWIRHDWSLQYSPLSWESSPQWYAATTITTTTVKEACTVSDWGLCLVHGLAPGRDYALDVESYR